MPGKVNHTNGVNGFIPNGRFKSFWQIVVIVVAQAIALALASGILLNKVSALDDRMWRIEEILFNRTK